MTLLIRAATLDDHDALIAQIWTLNCFEQELTHDRRTDLAGARETLTDMIAAASEDGALLVAEQDGTVSGHLCLLYQSDDAYVIEELRDHALISSLFVNEPWRGKGIARGLIAHAEALCKARGVQRLRLFTLSGNARARHIYEEAGFSVQGLDMVKPLTS
ncbi:MULTISPECIES: GNAT family N-acetyltransferase [unclassified Acidocella]|uniref:GNAT family N-acetyltransferase n=1 Tax=unclassified Acidocella TaxID=2648610 RepID=UPI00143A27AB|nr:MULTISPECIES: GNAT family N-acetyltransferase [unclassified Acidocella]WBO61178.1 GNAT family N-acetyltransferase [Acidocella sp. MX-AZ03]